MKKLAVTTLTILALPALAEEAVITGTIESKCVINTDVNGVYGNPVAGTLSTLPADGGVLPIIRYDIALGNAYTARITAPSSFSTAPSLNDVVDWSGEVEVNEVSDTAMSDYETSKVEYDYTTEFDMHTAGTTWFKVTSKAEYGYGKPYPAGTYRAIVMAECIAN
tara:strand:- start:1610 stop:2104 length:495 start_codon:yes stop_codon:yes gene_type:complete